MMLRAPSLHTARRAANTSLVAVPSCQPGSGSEDGEQDYVLVVAHANTLRALIMHLDEIAVESIEDINIPTAVPFYYDVGPGGGVVSKKQGGEFRGKYIYDDLKKRTFLERRRAAQDPWLWALRDDDVEEEMLLKERRESLDAATIEEEAKRNTEVRGRRGAK